MVSAVEGTIKDSSGSMEAKAASLLIVFLKAPCQEQSYPPPMNPSLGVLEHFLFEIKWQDQLTRSRYVSGF